jgi:hypothetical protein
MACALELSVPLPETTTDPACSHSRLKVWVRGCARMFLLCSTRRTFLYHSLERSRRINSRVSRRMAPTISAFAVGAAEGGCCVAGSYDGLPCPAHTELNARRWCHVDGLTLVRARVPHSGHRCGRGDGEGKAGVWFLSSQPLLRRVDFTHAVSVTRGSRQ